uniref:Uncharacterized protein n=1 Tax=Rhizophora mucronata TaxID=61149 RepID=A0A2P2NBS1_RHIMU
MCRKSLENKIFDLHSFTQ